MDERLLSSNDWERIKQALEGRRPHPDSFDRKNVQTGYTVSITVDRLDMATAEVRGHDMVLTIRRAFPHGHSSIQNFNTTEEAQKLLYGRISEEAATPT